MRIILAIFTDRFEVYGSLKPFFEQYINNIKKK
jgi:hypothetical protein